MRAKEFFKKINESTTDASNTVVAEVMKLIGEGHTEVAPDVITTKVSAALGRPFMLKDLVACNNSSPDLQHYIASINPSKIKFSTDILTVKNEDPIKAKEKAAAGVASMASRAASRPRLGESINEGWGRGNERVTLPDDSTLYWSGNGPLQKEYDALYNELVPSQGKADTIEGEVLRAASKIVYRHYNDGDEFNQESFEQLVPYIGAVTSYDDLAHKATEFAIKANGNYTPNPSWDSLDVMEYGPTQDDDDYDDEDEYYDQDNPDNWDDEDEDEMSEARTTWNSDWYVYNPETLAVKKKFRTYKGAKQYAEANGLKLAASEWYHDKINTQKQTDEGMEEFAKAQAAKRAAARKEKSQTKEGWESGPEEYEEPYDDADDAYDRQRQEKIDAEAERQQAKRPQEKYYTLSGRGPNYEPNYAFPGEYDSLEAAVAARAKLMADPSTPNPRDIGISTRTKYLDESRETPLRDREDYNAKKKALQDIQMDPHTSKDPELSTELIRRLAGLEKQRKDLK